MKNKKIALAKLKFRQLSELATKFNMSFSSHDLIGNKIIGFDGIQRKILIAEKNNIVHGSHIISIDEIKTISLKKVYNAILAGALKKRKIGDFLKTLVLQFELRNKNEVIIIPFYESVLNRLYDLARLERKARNWQLMLSKLINTNNSKLTSVVD